MATGRRLLEASMPLNYKQGLLYPVHNLIYDKDKPYGGSRKKYPGRIRKAGQTKVRKQLEKELKEELYESDNY